MFTPIGGRFLFWLIFFKGLKPPTREVFFSLSFALGFQTPCFWRYLGPKKHTDQTPSQQIFGRLGLVRFFYPFKWTPKNQELQKGDTGKKPLSFNTQGRWLQVPGENGFWANYSDLFPPVGHPKWWVNRDIPSKWTLNSVLGIIVNCPDGCNFWRLLIAYLEVQDT